MKHVYLAVPAYGHGVSLPTLRTIGAAIAGAADHGYHIHYEDGNRSLLCHNFNWLWCNALNMREAGTPLEWFVLLHADIGSIDPNWLWNLCDTAEHNELEALAAVAQIKDHSGDTSTALWRYGTGDIHRLSNEELRKWPACATNRWLQSGNPDMTLLINTGMLALRFGREWNTDEFYFHIEDGIERGADGKWRARVLSEDWRMSLWFAERGLNYGITQAIPVMHAGVWHWDSEVKHGDKSGLAEGRDREDVHGGGRRRGSQRAEPRQQRRGVLSAT